MGAALVLVALGRGTARSPISWHLRVKPNQNVTEGGTLPSSEDKQAGGERAGSTTTIPSVKAAEEPAAIMNDEGVRVLCPLPDGDRFAAYPLSEMP